MSKNKFLLALIVFGGIYYFYDQSFFHKSAPKVAIVHEAEPLSLVFLRVDGKVSVERDGKTEEVKEGLIIDRDCTIKTFEKSYAVLAYGPSLSSEIKIGQNTNFDLAKIKLNLPDQKEGLNLNLIAGDLLLKIFNPSKKVVLNIKTKHGVMKVRGTTFFVRTSDANSLLFVKEGAVEIEGDDTRGNLFVYADNGYTFDSTGKSDAVNLNRYKMDWDLDSPSSEILFLNNDFASELNIALEQFKKQTIDLDAKLKRKKLEITELEKSNQMEFLNLEKDIACLKSKVGNCKFKSEVFTKDILYNRGNLKNVLTSEISESMKGDIENYKAKLLARVVTMKKDAEGVENDISEHENKYQLARSKLDQLNSLEETKKEETKNTVYGEIVNILDSTHLRSEYQKIK